ncbi:TIGR03751 family conjugal transfer lipoprotein, partial [Pseudomonas paraeruginosa]|uniref:TIGR03751 family conjugal transfer lipoprotein n=1 Tax=Pseudomonas paraeruginosa TaxID=2994495 RepID=UPI003A4C61B1
MHKTWTDGLALLAMALLLGGCATSKEALLPHDNRSMLDIWNVETGGGSARQLLDARQALRRPLSEANVQAAPAVQARYTRTAANEIYRQFHRLPNPDPVSYTHLT